MPNITKPLGNLVIGTGWLWLLLFVGLLGPAGLWLARLPTEVLSAPTVGLLWTDVL